MASKIITISLPEDTARTAKEHAHLTGRNFSSLVRISLEKFIEQEKGVKQ